jgi:hypothetical protein
MQAIPFSEFGPTPVAQVLIHRIAGLDESRRAHTANRVFRRRPTTSQGHALEVLGHSIEYLVDQRMRRDTGLSAPADSVAEQVLMRLSREVFAECAKVVPAPTLRSRLSAAFSRLLGFQSE